MARPGGVFSYAGARSPLRQARPGAAAAKVWRWALLGAALGVLLGVLRYAPAVWVERAVAAASQGRVQLSQSTGTVWAGSAQLTLTGGAGSRDALRLPGRVQWGLQLGWGTLHLTLGADCCTPQPLALQVSPGWQRWEVVAQAHTSHWPAALLSGLGTPWNTLQPAGTLVLQTPGLQVHTALDRWSLEGQVQVQLQDMGSRLSTLRPLGSYTLQLEGGAQPRLSLSSRAGSALELRGQGQWSGGRLRFEGEATAQPAHAAELSNLLNIVGRRDGARSIITLG